MKAIICAYINKWLNLKAYLQHSKEYKALKRAKNIIIEYYLRTKAAIITIFTSNNLFRNQHLCT